MYISSINTSKLSLKLLFRTTPIWNKHSERFSRHAATFHESRPVRFEPAIRTHHVCYTGRRFGPIFTIDRFRKHGHSFGWKASAPSVIKTMWVFRWDFKQRDGGSARAQPENPDFEKAHAQNWLPNPWEYYTNFAPVYQHALQTTWYQLNIKHCRCASWIITNNVPVPWLQNTVTRPRPTRHYIGNFSSAEFRSHNRI